MGSHQPAHAKHSGQKNPIVKDGHLPVNEILFDRAGAPSPFGEDVEFPMPVDALKYSHPVDGATPTH